MEKLSISQVKVPHGMLLYASDGQKKPLPSPQWDTLVSVLDSTSISIPQSELDPDIVKWVNKKCKGWDLQMLLDNVKKYPRVCEGGIEREMQTEEQEEEVSPSPPVSPISIPQSVFVGQKVPSSLTIAAELSMDVDTTFTMMDYKTPSPSIVHNLDEMDFFKKVDEDVRVIPSSPFMASSQDLLGLVENLFQQIPIPEKDGVNPFEKETENIHGDLDHDLQNFDGEMKNLLEKLRDIFCPLPPHGRGCSL